MAPSEALTMPIGMRSVFTDYQNEYIKAQKKQMRSR